MTAMMMTHTALLLVVAEARDVVQRRGPVNSWSSGFCARGRPDGQYEVVDGGGWRKETLTGKT